MGSGGSDGSDMDDEDHQHHFFGDNIKNMFREMTSEEIAIWIDDKAKIVFPVAFVVFNIFYW